MTRVLGYICIPKFERLKVLLRLLTRNLSRADNEDVVYRIKPDTEINSMNVIVKTELAADRTPMYLTHWERNCNQRFSFYI
jgi:hypothetical protein